MANPSAIANAAAAWEDIHLAVSALYCLAGEGQEVPTREELAGLCLVLYEATASRVARTQAALATAD